MDIKEGLDKLSSLFMAANACMERQDYRAAITEYQKIIDFVQVLRKPFDNGEVPLGLISTVFPKILQSEQAAKDGIFVAQFGIEAQKKSAENQASANSASPEELSIENLKHPDVKQYVRHMSAATDFFEQGDYDSAITEYTRALERIRILQYLVVQESENNSPDLVLSTLDKVMAHELAVHQGLFSAYVKTGNFAKAIEEEKAINTLSGAGSEENTTPPPQTQANTQANAQAGGCFSVICIVVATLIFFAL